MAPHRPEIDEGTLTKARPKARQPRLYKVLLHNDDFTTMQFVVEILVRHFHKNETQATRIMLEVHKNGIGLAGIYPRDQAETKVAQVTAEAEEEGFPLLVTMEPEPSG
ncbi:MAG: ATP-dependent Clp protease adaptor ClpS [Gemmatimonas sp.]|nr:ATP-dependent Clp protease adaptor ClpS [Gemmatimonas sp.]